YSLGYPSKVSAQIFDLSGRVIESLVNEIQPAGQHLITWNSRDAVSGVYLLRMESSDFSDVRKVVLVR
ncbi:MAG: T9SS type A sorting domain-containing protein, partial [Bacteroidetes bacterium]|nr:T9SS type A sorting domain-containing protein [Bacteroidota bacterium]